MPLAPIWKAGRAKDHVRNPDNNKPNNKTFVAIFWQKKYKPDNNTTSGIELLNKCLVII